MATIATDTDEWGNCDVSVHSIVTDKNNNGS